MNNATSGDYRVVSNTFGGGDFTTVEYVIRNKEVSLCSEVIDNRHETLPGGRGIWVSTCATGRLTIDQAEEFIKVVRLAIADAKHRAAD